ncbi:hypothetical protein Ae201684_002431 [Aphanomyces euteiches]|uniref:Uncharacterized protein n=1 Tax=Aphanomyces euteiches TaxID=100861 RepID=A0A6G0XQZ2_9STRA|nr:hypothetical protein Ae201684_002431 [Aphanomyces euteiches]KAH9132804.1 hypothetical protein AeRB84_020868 [Aphanomyces euteiches]
MARTTSSLMAQTKSTKTDLAMKKALELSTVKFTSQPSTDAFRVQVWTSDDDIPMKIWLENKRSKEQWECVTRDVAENVPKGAKYALPSPVIVASFLTALSTKDTAEEKASEYSAFERFTAEYVFNLTPLEIAATDMLAAKIRDLQDEVAALKQAKVSTVEPSQVAELQAEAKRLRSKMEASCNAIHALLSS